MKLKYFLTAIFAGAIMFAGCVKEDSTDSFSNLKVNENYFIVSDKGETVTLTVTSTEAWKFVVDENWPEELSFNKDAGGKTIKAKHDRFGNLTNDEADIKGRETSWLVASQMGGEAGETNVTFDIPSSEAGREIEIALYAGDSKQYVRFRQGSLAAVEKTCAEIKENAVVGSSYITSGNVSRLGDYAKYGAFWIIDATGVEVQVYGSTNESKENYPDVEVGDYVKFSGVWSSYGNFENAEIMAHEKSLIKVTSEVKDMPKTGGELVVTLAYKGEGAFPTIKEDCREWISYDGMDYKPGVPSKLEPSPADTAIVTFNVAANAGGLREGVITFASYSKAKDDKTGEYKEVSSSVDYIFNQEGDIEELTVAAFLEKTEGASLYKLTGRVSNIKNTTYGNFDLVDATGSVYVYGLTATKVASNDKSFASLGIKEGDILTLIGTRDEYNGPQVGGPAYYVSHVGHTEVTVAEFNAKKEDDTKYKLTGTIKNLQTGDYGNFDLEDATGTVAVYGLTVAPVEKNDKSFPKLGLKEGDKVTLIGTRTSYKGAIQVGGPAYYVSHEAAAEGGEDGGEVTPPAEGGNKTVTLVEAGMPTGYYKNDAGEYAESVVTYDGIEFAVYTTADYDNSTGIQMRKGGAYIRNVTPLKNIKSIKATWEKNFYPENIVVKSGETTMAATTDATAMTATYDFTGGTYTEFKLENPSGYAVYFKSIEIVYGE